MYRKTQNHITCLVPYMCPAMTEKLPQPLTDTLVPVPEDTEQENMDTEQENKDTGQKNKDVEQEEEAEDKDIEADEETDYMDNINDTIATLRVAYV